MYPYSTHNRPIRPVPPGFDPQTRPPDPQARALPWYLVPCLVGLVLVLYFKLTLSELPTRQELNIALGFGSAMAVIGLAIGVSKGLLKRSFSLWKLARTVAAIYLLWLLAGLVALAVNLLAN